MVRRGMKQEHEREFGQVRPNAATALGFMQISYR